jgi:hypothetical protein
VSGLRQLEHWNPEESVMDDIHEALFEAMSVEADSEEAFDPKRFEETLAEFGYMIVPIEDPTNLRFGVE